MQKGQEFTWSVFAFNSSGDHVTGDAANITATLYQDGATSGAATTDTNPVELGTQGQYIFTISSAETSVTNQLTLDPVSSSAFRVLPSPATVSIAPANFDKLGIETDGDLTKVNTLDGHTPQTGDTYAQLPTNFSSLGISSGGAVTNVNLVDVCTSNSDMFTTAQSQTSCTSALNAYDPPTRTELTSDTNSILSGITFGTGTVQSDIASLNNFDPSSDVVLLSSSATSPTLTADVKTAMEADGGDLSSLMEGLINKRIWTEATGDLEMFNDVGVSQGTVTSQVTSDGTYTIAKRAFR